MPLYEYECDACGHEFEELQRMSERPIRKCPKCRKLRVRRLISGGAGVIFKGSGFYETDYKRKRAAPAASEASGESKDSKDSGGGSDSSATPAKKDGEKPAASGGDAKSSKGGDSKSPSSKGGKQSGGKD